MTEPSWHLAILRQPFLNLILDGAKTVESRFSQKRISLFRKVEKGEVKLPTLPENLIAPHII